MAGRPSRRMPDAYPHQAVNVSLATTFKAVMVTIYHYRLAFVLHDMA